MLKGKLIFQVNRKIYNAAPKLRQILSRKFAAWLFSMNCPCYPPVAILFQVLGARNNRILKVFPNPQGPATTHLHTFLTY